MQEGRWRKSNIKVMLESRGLRCATFVGRRRLEDRGHRIDDAAEPAFARALARSRVGLLAAAALGDRGRLPRLEERVAVAVPSAAGIIVAEHGRGLLRLLGEAERHIAFGQAMQRLRHMRRRLMVVDDALEAVDGGEIEALLLGPAADLHLLAGELVARQIDLEPPL